MCRPSPSESSSVTKYQRLNLLLVFMKFGAGMNDITILIPATKAYRGTEKIAPRILTLRSRWRKW